MLLDKAKCLSPAHVPCRGSTLPNPVQLLLLHQELIFYHPGHHSDLTVPSLYPLLHFPCHLHSCMAIRSVSGLQRRVVSISASPCVYFITLEMKWAEIWLLQLSWVKFALLYYFFKVLGFKCSVQMWRSRGDGRLR